MSVINNGDIAKYAQKRNNNIESPEVAKRVNEEWELFQEELRQRIEEAEFMELGFHNSSLPYEAPIQQGPWESGKGPQSPA
jgi:hypothetical protein